MSSIRYTLNGDYNSSNSDVANADINLSSRSFNLAYADSDFDAYYAGNAFFQSRINRTDGYTELRKYSDSLFVDFSDKDFDVTLKGGEKGDILYSGAGNDTLNGGGGSDVLEGGLGSNTIKGGGPNESDTVSYEHYVRPPQSNGSPDPGVGVTVDLGDGTATDQFANFTQNLSDELTYIQNVRGSQFRDFLKGSSANNVLEGGAGGDLLNGNGGSDTASYEHAGAGVTANLADASQNTGDAAGDTYTDMANLLGSANVDSLTGDGNANKLTGLDGADTLDGMGGNDLLDGGLGADNMTGGSGNDSYVVDNAGDSVIEATGGGVDSVYVRPSASLTSYTLAAGEEVEVLATTRAIGGRDIDLTGNETGQTIYGNAGANVLDGKAGVDQLVGGNGADTFVFSTTLGATNVDRIVDFSAGDAIRLSKSIFAELDLGTLGEGAFKDLGAPGATVDADDHILYDGKGRLFYDADGAGGSDAVLFARVSYRPTLTHDDFFVV